MRQAKTPQEFAAPEWLIANAKVGDRVTIATPQGQTRAGRMVMRGPAGLVLNLGGPHGTPGVATVSNIVSVKFYQRVAQ